MNNLTPPPPKSRLNQARSLASQEVACGYCGLFGMCEQAGLSRDTQLLEQVVNRRSPLKRGSTLFHAGEPFKYLYAVKSGALATVVNSGEKGQRKIFGFFFPGDVLGFDGIDGGHYLDSVEALENSTVCKLDYDNVALLGEHQGGFYQELIHAMGRRLNAERWIGLLLGAQSTEQRLAAFLLYLTVQLRQRDLPSSSFRLPMSRRDIADYLGVAMESISRAFSALQKRGLLQVQGRNMQLLNLEALQQVAGLDAGQVQLL